MIVLNVIPLFFHSATYLSAVFLFSIVFGMLSKIMKG